MTHTEYRMILENSELRMKPRHLPNQTGLIPFVHQKVPKTLKTSLYIASNFNPVILSIWSFECWCRLYIPFEQQCLGYIHFSLFIFRYCQSCQDMSFVLLWFNNCQGSLIRCYTELETKTKQYKSNPDWQMMGFFLS